MKLKKNYLLKSLLTGLLKIRKSIYVSLILGPLVWAGPSLKFKADEPVSNSNSGSGLKFKSEAPEENKPKVKPTISQFEILSADPDTDGKLSVTDQGYKTYLDYPKHQVSFFLMPLSTSMKWTYTSLSQDFNLKSNSFDSFGVAYSLFATPQLNLKVDLNYYSISINSASVSGLAIQKGQKSLTNLFLRGGYDFISDKNFFNRWGFGFEMGYDAYPILDFATNSSLELSSVNDLVFGGFLASQYQLMANLGAHIKIGYDIGTGAGNSGALTSKSNSIYYLAPSLSWQKDPTSTITAGVDYRVRSSKISGRVGNNEDTWQTSATNVGFLLSYARDL